jgi:hypothetical protein
MIASRIDGSAITPLARDTFEYTAVVLSVIELTFTVKPYCFGRVRPCRHFVSVEEGSVESVMFNGFSFPVYV